MTAENKKLTQKDIAARLAKARLLHIAPKSAEQRQAERRQAEEQLAAEFVKAAKTAIKNDVAGAIMLDGTVYAGVSPDTGQPFYTTPADEPSVMYWASAVALAEKKEAYACHDWRLPSKGELSVLFNNQDEIGGFTDPALCTEKQENPLTGFSWSPTGWYWSSSRGIDNEVWAQRFTDGKKDQATDGAVFVRLVRG